MKMFVDLIRREFEEFFGAEPEAIVSAPGRLDFLNTHQDYKGLPVVAIGINLRTYIAIKRSEDKNIVVGSGNIRDEKTEYVDRFPVDSPLLTSIPKWFGNYVRAAVAVLKESGYRIDGARLWIRSRVPIGSGLGSSGTLLVSIIGALNEVFRLGLDVKAIAELAYRAEHDIMGIPCGRLDQYAAAFGNVVYIETRPPYNVEVLKIPQSFFAVVDTGIRHSTADIHPKRQQEIDEGLAKLMTLVPENLKAILGNRYWEPRWELLDLAELGRYLDTLSDKPKKRILYTIKAHRSTVLAIKALKGIDIAAKELCEVLEVDLGKAKEILRLGVLGVIGATMVYQHRLLSELYDVSLPQIDALVEELLKLGALGAKLSGAGLGGAVIALFSNKVIAENAVKHTVGLGYAAQGWIVEVDEGVKVHGW